MKLIRQSQLVFQEGRSDKVYEIDLCEVGQDRYVVNFRYGRRGTNLKEGTKTSSPVALAAAEKVFNGLVTEKTKKGYRQAGDRTAQKPPKAAVSKETDAEARKQAVLRRLAEEKSTGILAKKPRWPVERAIWRAGELKIKEAAPLLIRLLGSGNPLRDYCLSWALGFCGDEETIPVLSRLYQDAQTPDMVRRIACEALLKLADETSITEFREHLLHSLPQELTTVARNGSADAFEAALSDYLNSDEAARFAVLDTLYLIDSATVRPALLNRLRTAPLKPPYFQRLRHIFKAAEYRRDAEVYGLLAYRFEKTRALFSSSYRSLAEDGRWPVWVSIGGGYSAENYVQDARKEIQSPTSRIGYSTRTRHYLRGRVWRTLNRMGKIGDADFVKMAVGVLLPFSDADAQPLRETSSFNPSRRDFAKTHWDAYAGYWAFNSLLYSNSPRYARKRNSLSWHCQPPYQPGNPAPDAREEAFPQLWSEKPQGLLHLIAESSCTPVLAFAVRALQECAAFCAAFDSDTIAMILERPYAITAQFGFQLAKARYNALTPDRTLVLAVANCALEEARLEAHNWIFHARQRFAGDHEFLAALVFSSQADTREFARRLLAACHFSETEAARLVSRLIEELCGTAAEQSDRARDAATTILQCFAPHLRALDLKDVLALLNHQMLEAQELGGHILLQHETPVRDLPVAIIHSLIASPYESLRGIGIKLFGQTDDESLWQRDNLIAAFAMHEAEDIRQAIRPVIRRLCFPPAQPDPRNEIIPTPPVTDPLTPEQRKTFALNLAAHLLRALLEPELHAGVHTTLVKIMREDVGIHWMKQATRGTAWQLLGSASQAAQELGGVLISFKANGDYEFTQGFDFTDLVELSNHEVREVRNAACGLFPQMLHRLQAVMNPDHHFDEMVKAIKLLDAKWDDSREFWFKMFDLYFTDKDFTPGLLVSICDSVRGDVQALGRKLITRYFAEADGQEYLLKLSEHPSAELQTFATNYLERYAADSPARLRDLRYYFISVLSRVNKARVAKDRVLAFLTAEAEKHEEAAQLVAEVLTRQSVTLAIGDKAAAIEAMLKIKRTFPHLALPIEVRQPEVRHAL